MANAKRELKYLSYLPQTETLKKADRRIVLDRFRETDFSDLYSIYKEVIEEGQTFPYESVESEQEFRQVFLGYDVFVVRDENSNEVLGSFYVKPNYPGRSSHICNAAFMVKKICQGQGIGSFMVPKYLRVASDLGYRASMLNLVYVTNVASAKLWQRFGFKEIGRLPNAGDLKGFGYVDAIQYYYDLTTVSPLCT